MWNELSQEWQQCFELVWEAFKDGARPIAAFVTDKSGNIVSTGKSTVFQYSEIEPVSHNELAHAEVNALLKLDNRIHQDTEGYTLYTSLEPCPLCFSAFYMSGLRNLQFGAFDKYGGSTNLCGTTPYLSRKPIKMIGPVPHFEDVSAFFTVYFDISKSYAKGAQVHNRMKEDYPEAVQLGRDWGGVKKLEQYRDMPAEKIFTVVSSEIQCMKKLVHAE